MTLASFVAEPREVNLDRNRQVVSYLINFKYVTIRISTEEPGLCYIPIAPYEWEESVYGKVTELLPQEATAPKGKHVVTVNYYEANLCHDIVTGMSVTGVLHFIKKTPID